MQRMQEPNRTLLKNTINIEKLATLIYLTANQSV